MTRSSERDRSGLDPFRILLSVVAAKNNSDALIELTAATGLRFDIALSGAAAYSHSTRVRALMPRILAAYEALEAPDTLGVANAFVTALTGRPGLIEAACDQLRRVGWDIQDGQLVAAEPELREMFFPKGSRWDAFVVLRDLLGEASKSLLIVDPYCDHTLFQLLAARAERPVAVRVLCGRSAEALEAEARVFVEQHHGWSFDIRRGNDFHDRFVVLDEATCVHVGASINGAGKTAFMVSRMEDPANRVALLTQLETSWSSATRVSSEKD